MEYNDNIEEQDSDEVVNLELLLELAGAELHQQIAEARYGATVFKHLKSTDGTQADGVEIVHAAAQEVARRSAMAASINDDFVGHHDKVHLRVNALSMEVGSAIGRVPGVDYGIDKQPDVAGNDVPCRKATGRVGLKLLTLLADKGIGMMENVQTTKPRQEWSRAERNKYNQAKRVSFVAAAESAPKQWVRFFVLDRSSVLTVLIDSILANRRIDPWRMPMLHRPADWKDDTNFGYVPIIRHASLDYAAERCSYDDMPDRYKALNYLQSTKWRINKQVYDVLEQMWDNSEYADVVPLDPFKHSIIDPALPEDSKALLLKSLSSKFSSSSIMRSALRAGNGVRLRQPFYLAWNYDFRGRAYPLTVYGPTPQGTSLQKAMLLLGDARKLSEKGIARLKRETATHYGYDKWLIQDRIDWADENLERFAAIGNDPIGRYDDWKGADDPWQFLACCFEWSRFVECRRTGEDFHSGILCQDDGSVNGFQWLTALTRDDKVASYVNLTADNNAIGDFYMFVVSAVKEQFAGHPFFGKADDNGVNGLTAKDWRSMGKIIVMLKSYNGGVDTVATDILIMAKQSSNPYLRSITFDQCEELATESNVVMTKAAAGPASLSQRLKMVGGKAIRPIYYKLPSGFPIRLTKYKKTRTRASIDWGTKEIVDTETGEIREEANAIQLSLWFDIPVPDQEETSTGAAPNYIHSLDSEHMIATALLLQSLGVKAFTAVHDSFWVSVEDSDELYTATREAFVNLVESVDIAKTIEHMEKSIDFMDKEEFNTLRREAKEDFDYLAHTGKSEFDIKRMVSRAGAAAVKGYIKHDHLTSKATIILGTFDINEVLSSDYFFA